MPVLNSSLGPKLAVGGLLLLNVFLIGALVVRNSSLETSAVPAPLSNAVSTPAGEAEMTPSPSGSPTASPSGSPSPSSGPSSSPSASDSPSSDGEDSGTSSEPDELDPRPALLAANSDRVAWRAQQGRCGSETSVDVSEDGGRSWRATAPGIGSIVRLKTFGSSSVFAVGADDDCRPTYAWINEPRGSWSRDAGRTDSLWYRTPGDLDLVHAPGDGTSRPCGKSLVGLAGLGTFQAAALCADGRLRTVDQGRGWRTTKTGLTALSVNADDDRFVVALQRKGCRGVIVRTFDADGSGLDGSAGRCRKPAPADREITVAHQGDAVWLWRDKKVSVY